MAENSSSQASKIEEEETEVLSQYDEAVYTGQSCSQVDASSVVSPTDKNQPQRTEEGAGEGSFDPDLTYIDVSKLRGKNDTMETSKDQLENGNVTEEQSNLSNGCSQESTQPIAMSQEIEESQPAISDDKAESSNRSIVDETFELIQSQDIQNTPTPPKREAFKDQSETYSRMSTLEVKQSGDVAVPNPDDQCSLRTASAVSTSSSSSQIVSSSSSSKRATESDDTDDMILGSQDMFESQGSGSSQNNVISVSQFVPTLQLSGDIPSSQGYERFLPSRLYPSSPTTGLTSTPLRHDLRASGNNAEEVISLSDEEDVQKLSEKRKLSDSSDEAKANVKRPKKGFDSRQSVTVLGEVNVFKKPSLIEPEDNTIGSQGFSLHLSQTESESPESQATDFTSPLTIDNSWKADSEGTPQGLENKPKTTIASTAEHDISVVSIDDVEDEIQFVSPRDMKSTTVGEITLDSSGQADIEVLSPLGNNGNKRRNLNATLAHDSSVECSPFGKQQENQNSSIHCKDLNSSKENIQPSNMANLQEFENEFVMAFTCTFKVTCKASIDMLKKETAARSIPSFEILESRTVVRRDSSPSAVEESSPGRGGGSPGSVVSGPGPFPLQLSHAARMSMYSTTSSSSAGSAASIYRQASARRGRALAQTSHLTGKTSPVREEGLVLWRELLSQRQDELALSAASHLDKWESSRLSNSSSDESKTVVEDRVLDTVPEVDDPEEVLGIPPAKSMTNLMLKKRLELLSNSSSTSAHVKSEQKPSDVENIVKADCETSPPIKRKRGRVARPATPRTPRGSSKKKAPTPKKISSDVPPVQDHSSLPDDTLSSGSCYFTPGSQVFAEWNRGQYYPGQLGSAIRPNHWNVLFHDGKKKDLSTNEIHLINTFVIGQAVCAMDSSGKYTKGTVEEVIPGKDGQEDLFKIKLVLGEIATVPITHLCLTESQIHEITGELPGSTTSTCTSTSSPSKRASASKISNIDLDNIVAGKRVRTPKASQSGVNSPGRPGPSNTARRLIADSCGSSATEDEPLATNLVILPNITGVEAEQVGFEKTADPLARKGRGVKKSASKKPLPDIDNEKIVQELGPIPPEGSCIFAGYSFLLTITDVVRRHRHEPVTDSERNTTDAEEHPDDDSSQCVSDFECFEFTRARMVKDRLIRQITQGGGKVLKHWTEIVPKNINNTYVVSNRPSATAIYIQCLVRGVKCINHDYIIHCCREFQRLGPGLKANILPAGYSLKKREWRNWNDLKSKLPLQGENILIDGEQCFKTFWEEVLKQSGANVLTVKSIKGDFNRLTKVLSERRCSEVTLKHAREKHTPVVSPSWVIQSLVENEALPYDEQQCFAHDYVDCD